MKKDDKRIVKQLKKFYKLLKDDKFIKSSKDIKLINIETQETGLMEIAKIKLNIKKEVRDFVLQEGMFRNILGCSDFLKDFTFCSWGEDKKDVTVEIEIVFNKENKKVNTSKNDVKVSFEDKVTKFVNELRNGCQDLKDNAECKVEVKSVGKNYAKIEMIADGNGFQLIENDIENANDEIYDMVENAGLSYKHNEIYRKGNTEVVFVIDLVEKGQEVKKVKEKKEKKEIKLDGEMTVYEVGLKKIKRMTQKEFIKKFGKDENEGLKIWNKLRESFAEGTKYTNYYYGTTKDGHDITYRLVKKIKGQEAYLVAGLWLNLQIVKQLLR